MELPPQWCTMQCNISRKPYKGIGYLWRTGNSIDYTVVPATRGHCRFGPKVSPRGRDRNVDRHVCTLVHIIVYALLMHTQTRSESNENREIPTITTCTVCPLHGINRHNKSTIVCKCIDNSFQTNVYISAILSG